MLPYSALLYYYLLYYYYSFRYCVSYSVYVIVFYVILLSILTTYFLQFPTVFAVIAILSNLITYASLLT